MNFDRQATMLGNLDSILFDNAPVAYSLLDMNGRQIGGNTAYWDLMGYDPSEAHSIDAMRLTHPEDRQLTAEYFARLLSGEEDEITVQKRYIRKDGSQFTGQLKARVVRDEIGESRFMVGVINDITEQLETQHQLEQSVRSQAQFVAAVSHELRSPLHSILGLAELLTFSLKGEARSQAETIVRQGESLRALIDDILEMSRINSRTVDLKEESFDPAMMVTHVAEMIRGETLDGVELRINNDRSLPETVDGPRTRLEQVLVNLASNACKYTSVGHVTIATRRLEGDSIRFSVTDTGSGISSDHLDHIFEMFVQPDGGRGGVGLGLSISKGLVEQMGGSLQVESTLGEGSSFWFEIELPAASVRASTGRPQALSTGPVTGLGKVLVVDDSEVNRMLASGQLSRLGYSCDLADDGASALARFEPNRYVAVLMDWYMPDMDGLATTRAIRKMETVRGWERTPIIAVTASAMAGDREACIAAGMDDFLPKPTSLEQIRQVLDKWARTPGSGPKGRNESPSVASGSDVDSQPIAEALRRFERELNSTAAALDVMAAFVDELHSQASALRSAASNGDRARASIAAHSLKGACRSIGANSVANACETIERSARSLNSDFAAKVDDVCNEVDTLAPVAESLIAERRRGL